MEKRIIVAITGASGMIYAKRLLELVADFEPEIYMIVSSQGMGLLRHELGEPVSGPQDDPRSWLELSDQIKSRIHVLSPDDLAAPPASGTFPIDGMVVVPCSMKTLSAIAHGYADNLITRSADVQLKERRSLVLVPRESPMNAIHLENLATLARLGASIVPASPPFYHQPRTIAQLVDAIAFKALAQLGFHHPKAFQWGAQ